ncbi:MAG: ribonuclease HI family protein [Armatimonadetes bacterium]|nr:ribonuclease HI family protein [Armatimonadota bacterium]
MGKLAGSADYLLIFDGGSINNPGLGYGSYLLIGADGRSLSRRLEFGPGVTNNQAEYMALIAGLRDLLATIESRGARPADHSLEVRGDSALVINQLGGRWKVKNLGLKTLQAEARQLLNALGQTTLVWTPRAHSVRALGH